MAQTLEHNKAVTEVIPVTLSSFDDDLQIIQKLDDEPNDVGGLTAAELKAKFDEGNITAQQYINNVLIPAVVADNMTEQSRQAAEAERVANEIERVGNEEARVQAEAEREQAIAKVENLTANASTVSYGTPASAEVTTNANGSFNIHFNIPQGKNGDGSGDMQKSVYDPQNKRQDVFKYVDDKVDNIPVPEGNGVKVYEASIGTTWVENEDTGVKTQTVAIADITATNTAKVDHSSSSIDGTSDGYALFVEEENQYLTCITNGYAETVAGGIQFTIFGDANTVAIPIVVEVV